jgi:hypothetical protein
MGNTPIKALTFVKFKKIFPPPYSASLHTADSRTSAMDRQPERSFPTSKKESGEPIRIFTLPGRGRRRDDGHASNVPFKKQGTTGTDVPAVSIPIPALNRPIFPERVRVPSGKIIYPHSPSTNRSRNCISDPLCPIRLSSFKRSPISNHHFILFRHDQPPFSINTIQEHLKNKGGSAS